MKSSIGMSSALLALLFAAAASAEPRTDIGQAIADAGGSDIHVGAADAITEN